MSFLQGNINVTIFFGKLEEVNRSGLWDNLNKSEYKLLSEYFRIYADMYCGETLPKFSFWERLKRNMQGYPNIDLKTLRKGTEDLLSELEKLRDDHPPS